MQPPDDFTTFKGVCKTEVNKTLHIIALDFVIQGSAKQNNSRAEVIDGRGAQQKFSWDRL